MGIVAHIPKGQRYTIGVRVENKLLDLSELAYITYFTPKETRLEKITECILVLDTLKFLVHITWEAKLISHKHYEEIGQKLEEVGRMFGGWKKNLEHDFVKSKNHTL